MSSIKPNHRWYLISIVATITVVVVGWMYFFVGQIAAFGRAVPQTFATTAVKDAVNQTTALGQDTFNGAKQQLNNTGLVQDLQNHVKAAVEVGTVIDALKKKIETNQQ